MESIKKTTRCRPTLKLDISAALKLEVAQTPIIIREYQSPILSLEWAKRELSKNPLPEYVPDMAERHGRSRDQLQHSGDAGCHDYLHWALHHPGKQPLNSWDLCNCDHGNSEIDSVESEPMTENELAQRRLRLQETLADLEAFTPSPMTVQLQFEELNGDITEAIDEDLSDFPFVIEHMNSGDSSIQDPNEGQTYEDAIEDVEFLNDLQIDLDNAPFVSETGQEVQTNDNNTTAAEQPELGHRTLDSLIAPPFRVSLAGLAGTHSSLWGESSGESCANSSDNDSEQFSSSSRHKGVFIPAWLWCVLWSTLIGFLIGFFIMMSLFIAYRNEGMLDVGKAAPCSTPRPCECDVSPEPYHGGHGMDHQAMAAHQI
ncbi:hypothetical protein CORC01_05010 [Colletotrichum orchidophilum]|uniref:Uncharacterized protein n=1 Tax=Colletotrichum orchidophilum TaxID=1209926 RepID=A0A1G4BE89_9PEZI|nr:uncharacterized protein CORC01_05010 [Colletotrichum orchidophilum]OHE99652.1 hypothetical protein CORC01_05010 [Colletotrichum orchidophilum]